jgi:hypothetical protein
MSIVVNIDDPNFIERMNEWYISTHHRKDWLTTIPTNLSYFTYWLTKTNIKNIEVNSTIFAGKYYCCDDIFSDYILNAKKLKYRYGYPFSVFVKKNNIYIGQFTEYGSFSIKVPRQHFYNPEQFIMQFGKNLKFKSDDGFVYVTTDSFYRDTIYREIKQLFIDI